MATSGPNTSLHLAANGNFVNGVYAPAVDGFNLADVSSASDLAALPAGVKGLDYLGMTDGVTSAFIAAVDAVKNSPNLYGFYLVDEPNASATTAANLKAETDYIKANVPGAVTFMVEQNLGSETSPSFYYTPANTGIDLFGLDPYPVQTNVPNGLDYNTIPLAVSAAEQAGIPLASIVPVYQAFGGGNYTTYTLPTPTQEQQILATWGSVVPNPAFDYAYSWGTQEGDTALSNDPALAAVFAAHNASSTGSSTTTSSGSTSTGSSGSTSGGTSTSSPTITATVPTVAISTATATVTQAAQTIQGTVDAADNGTTVTVLDGGTAVGTATVANGAWSASVTLGAGANVITATDANAAGTGTSNSITLTLASAPSSSPSTSGSTSTTGSTSGSTSTGGSDNAPTLTVADTSVTVTGGGGTTKLGIDLSAPDSASSASVTIKGLPRYETIVDGLGDSFHGRSITMTAAQVESGLTLISNYTGTSHPVATLQVTANDTVAGVTYHSATQSITVDDPPPTSSSSSSQASNSQLALLNQYVASGFGGDAGAALTTAAATHWASTDSWMTTPRH